MIFKHKWGQGAVLDFPLYLADGSALQASATLAAGDVKIIKDEGTAANTTNLPVNETNGMYSLTLTAAETQATRIAIAVDDATATETFLSIGLVSVLDGDYQGAVWMDSGASNTGTVVGTHGLPHNPVSSLADAITLAGLAKTGLRKILVCNGSLNLPSAPGKIHIQGNAWLVEVIGNNQQVIDTLFTDIGVSGTFASGLCDFKAVRCDVGPCVNMVAHLFDCFLVGDNTVGAGGLYCYGCSALDLGVGVALDLATNNARVELHSWSGELTLENMDSTNYVLVEGTGKITIDSSCTGGTLVVRGDIQVVDLASNAVTVSYAAIGLFSSLFISTTVTSGASQTGFVATGLPSSGNDRYIDRTGYFITGTLAGQQFSVLDYDGSTKTLTVTTLPSTPSVGDVFVLT